MTEARLVSEFGLAMRFAGITFRPCRATREEVFEVLELLGETPFTTAEVAKALRVNEYSARAAISWLKLAGFIEIIGWHCTREHVRVYRWTGKAQAIRTCRRNQGEREMQLAEDQAERMREAASRLGDVLMRMGG